MPVAPPTTVNVRYMVHDVDAAIAWYTKHLGFTVLTNYTPAFADVTLGSLRLLLSGPTSSAGRPMPDGARPEAGGWNRVHLLVDDLPGEVARLRGDGHDNASPITSVKSHLEPVPCSAVGFGTSSPIRRIVRQRP